MRFLSKILLGILWSLFTLAATGAAQDLKVTAKILSSSQKIVTGAPFSAEAVGESVQIMYDGNKITRSVKTRMYRDSQGRFRREEMPKPVGMGSFVEMPQMIVILDPVSRVETYLDPKSKTARQSVLKDEDINREKEHERRRQEEEKRRQEDEKRRQKKDKRRQEVEERGEENGGQTDTDREVKPRAKKAKGAAKQTDAQAGIDAKQAEIQSKINAKIQSKTDAKQTKEANKALNQNPFDGQPIPALPAGKVNTESLGVRKIEGVEAEGTRLTTTVAAGSIGNERAFDIVYERWYSKDLQLIVFSKYVDPRFGEQTYRLTNIKRDEPAAALFTLPTDYVVVSKPSPRAKKAQ